MRNTKRNRALLETYLRTRRNNLNFGFTDHEFPRVNVPIALNKSVRKIDLNYLQECNDEEIRYAWIRKKYESFDERARSLERFKQYRTSMDDLRVDIWAQLKKRYSGKRE